MANPTITEWIIDSLGKFNQNAPKKLTLKKLPALVVGGGIPKGMTGEALREFISSWNDTVQKFTRIENDIQEIVNHRTPEISATAKAELVQLVNGINALTQQTGRSEPAYVEAVMKGFKAMGSVLEGAEDELRRLSADVHNPGNSDTNPSQTDQGLLNDLGRVTDDNRQLTDDEHSRPDSRDIPDLSRASDPAGAVSGPLGSQIGSGIGSDLMTIANQMAMDKLLRRGLSRDREDLDRRNEDDIDGARAPQDPPPVAITPLTTGTPWSPTGNAAPAVPTTPNSAGEGSTPPNTPNSAPRVDADGNPWIDYHDGKGQFVAEVAKPALEHAQANKETTDAQGDFAGTAAAWQKPENGKVSNAGEPIGTDEIESGCVAEFSDRTVMLRVFRTDDLQTCEAIVQGAFKPFSTTEMYDDDGSFGEFRGFRRPKGVQMKRTSTGSEVTPGTTMDQPQNVPADALPA